MNHRIVKEIADHGICPDGVGCSYADKTTCVDCWGRYLREAEHD